MKVEGSVVPLEDLWVHGEVVLDMKGVGHVESQIEVAFRVGEEGGMNVASLVDARLLLSSMLLMAYRVMLLREKGADYLILILWTWRRRNPLVCLEFLGNNHPLQPR